MVFLRRCKIRQFFSIRSYSHIPSHSFDGPYDPTLIEQDWYKWWQENGFFSPKYPLNEYSSCDRVITILPPPNITGILHLGHALTISIQDALIRWERMRGKSVMWIPGTDHAGIATQSIIEQFLMKTRNLKRKNMTRRMFEDIIWKWKDLNVAHIYNQIAFMGASLDWSKEFFTLDSSLSKVVTNCFIQLFNEGLIYRDMKMVNWSCSLETVISDIEVDHRVITKPTEIMIRGEPIEFGVLHKIAYPLVDPCDITEVVVSTSRVETIPGDRAISVHPNDIRFLNLHGKYCYHPLDPHIKIPIIPDEMVDPNFGTGAVKVTPAHDPDDYIFSIRHKIPVVNVFDYDGRMNASCLLPELQHIDRLKCRKYILSKLKDKGLYRGSQNYQTSISFCSRSGDIIEYFLKSQWYLKTGSLASKLHDNLALKFSVLPQHYSNEWIKWLENIEDWCISRQLWWGHRIPAWYVNCENGYWIVADSEQAALEISGGKDVKQDLDVLDTWFSSALLPLSVFRWDNKNIPIEYPLTFIESGSDLLFFWILRMALLCTYFTGKFPFNEIILHPLIRDSQGRKMSKSLGNIIDPLQIIKGFSLEISEDNAFNGNDLEQDMKYHLKTARKKFSGDIKAMGTDSLRFSLIDYTKQTHQINMDIANVSSAKYILSKLWNATKFFLCQIKYYNLKIIDTNFKSEHIFDKYIISRLKETINACNMGFELRKLFDVTKCLRRFIVYDLCSVYLEFIKQELKQNDNKRAECALSILYSVLYTVVKLLHPIAPFITEELYQKLLMFDPNSKISIMISNYPHKNGSFYLDNDSIKRIENIMMLVHEFRSMISNVGRLSYEHEGVIEINNRNKIFKEDVIKFKNIIQNMIGMKSLSLNDLNNGSLNVHSKFVNSELVLHLRLEKSYLDSFKQMSRIKWLEKQQDIISKRLKSEKYLQNASNCVQKKDIERLRDIQNELKLVRSFQKNAI